MHAITTVSELHVLGIQAQYLGFIAIFAQKKKYGSKTHML